MNTMSTTPQNLKEAVAAVKSAVDIVSYVENSGTSLKQTGMRFKGLCPFHNENTPSMNVDHGFQTYHCFGCGAHGDVLSFVQETENMSFWESLVSLAETASVDLSGLQKNQDKEDYEDISSLREIIRETARFFWKLYQKLPEDHRARTEIASRGMDPKNAHNIYGYAPEGGNRLYKHLQSKGFTDESIEKTGVCRKGKSGFFDMWQGRLMFIICDISGRPVGFSGRKLYESDKMGKYVNSVDSPVFNKSTVLFNVDKAKKPARTESEVFITEGQFDVMALMEAGSPNVVASSGTAFTKQQSSLLMRLVGAGGRLIFVFDGDDAGKNAVRKAFDMDPSIHKSSHVVVFAEGDDPDEYAQRHGHTALKEYLSDPKNRVPITEFVLQHEKESSDVDTPEGRSQYLERAAKILARVSNATLRREYSKIVSLDAGGVSMDIVDNAVKEASSAQSSSSTNVDGNRQAEQQDADNSGSSASRPELDEEGETPIETLAQRIADSSYHTIFARLLWIALARRDLVSEKLTTIQKSLAPKMFHRVIDELAEYPDDKPLIPENFTDASLSSHILDNYKPSEFFVASDDDMVSELTEILIRRLATLRVDQQRKEKRAKLLALLSDQDSSLEVFKRVVEEQEKTHETVSQFLEAVKKESVVQR